MRSATTSCNSFIKVIYFSHLVGLFIYFSRPFSMRLWQQQRELGGKKVFPRGKDVYNEQNWKCGKLAKSFLFSTQQCGSPTPLFLFEESN